MSRVKMRALRNGICGVLIFTGIGALGGCSSVYEPMVTKYAEANQTVVSIVQERAKILPHAQRVALLESQYPLDFDGGYDAKKGILIINEDWLTGFSQIACAGLDKMRPQMDALATNQEYVSVLKKLVKNPDQKIGALYKSIRDNWNELPALAPVKTENQHANCLLEVKNLVRLPPGATAQIGVAGMSLEDVKGAIKALEQVAIAGLSLLDEAVRSYRTKQYVTASKGTVAHTFEVLKGEDPIALSICAKFPGQPPCFVRNQDGSQAFDADKKPVTTVGNPPTFLDRLMLTEKWVSLRDPWRRYVAWQVWRKSKVGLSIGPDASTATKSQALQADRLEDFRRLAEIDKALDAYAAVRLQAAPKDLIKSMEMVQNDLVEVAEGSLSAEQMLAILTDLVERLDKAKKATDDATKKVDEALDAAR